MKNASSSMKIGVGLCLAAVAIAGCGADTGLQAAPKDSATQIGPISTGDLVLAAPLTKGSVTSITGSIANTTDHEVTVLGANAEFAKQIQVVRIRPNGVVLPGVKLVLAPGTTVTLAASGYELKVIGLNRDLIAGESLKMDITLAGTSSVPSVVTVS